MNVRRVFTFVFAAVLVLTVVRAGSARTAGDEASAFAAEDAQILSEIRDHSHVMENLEYLSDEIGPRLTGSPQLKQANDWTAAKFREYGLTNVHLEPWTIAHSWTRGTAQARIVSPAGHPLTIASAGWSPGTNGVLRGPVVYFEAKTKGDFEKFRGKLKGAIVIYQEPESLSPPKPENLNGGLIRPMQQPPPVKGQPPAPSPFATLQEAARARNEFFKVEVEIEMTNSFGDKPMDVYNTVAEIRGSERPDEVVILGAHLDSWDLGTGSTDNGTGSMAVLEAARTLAKLNLKPKRTIRFVLFSGEEEGLVGSAKYADAHRDEVVAPLKELKLLEPTMRRTFGTDHASFNEVGVPGFFVVQDGAEYNQTHHSQSDTFDKVWKDDLNQGAQVLAAWAYNTAQLPAMLPRRPLPYRPSTDAAKTEAPKPDPIAEMDTKILEQVKADQGDLKANLQYLADHIGPRLTGSPQLDQASHWTMERFKELGLTNAKLEPWTIANSWTRGPATGQIISPTRHVLTLETAGWSSGTKGALRGPVIGIAAEKPEDLQQYKGKLKGAIVVVGRATETISPGNPLLTPWGEETIPVARPKSDDRKPFDYDAYRKLRQAQTKFFAEEKVAAVLLGSEKWYGLLNMSVSGRDYHPGVVPTAYVTRENYTLLWRLLEAGAVEAEVNIESSFSGKPVEVYNTVAEIAGTEKPDEVVIVGGHLDSWDLGTGATDNGTGSMAVLEAARALQKLGVKPKRTIRFVLFTGEEQGLNGSKAYVKAHQNELGKISGVLVHDSGTGKVLTVGLMGNYGAREIIDHALYPLGRAKEVGLSEPSLRTEGGSDHVPFDEAGVSGFWCVQDNADYDKTHHSQADTIDRVRWDDLTEGAQVLAVFGYNVAQLPEMLPRKSANQSGN